MQDELRASTVPAQGAQRAFARLVYPLERLGHAIRRVAGTPLGAIGLFLVTLQLILVVIGPSIAPYPPTELHLMQTFQGPSRTFLLGTDEQGRDILSRVLAGARSIVLLSLVVTIVGMAVGILVGLAAGYIGGWIDEGVMRIMDGLMSFPAILLAMLILTTLGSSSLNIIVAASLVAVPRVARVVRSVVIGLRHREYVDAARLRGDSILYIWFREILPNASAIILVEASMRLTYAILLIASLGFLGLGVQPPTPDWGLMVSDGRQYIYNAPWMVIAPSIAIASLVVGVNLLANRLDHLLKTRHSMEVL